MPMSNGTSTIVAVFSIIASMAAFWASRATLLGRVMEQCRNRSPVSDGVGNEITGLRNEVTARLDSIGGPAILAVGESALDRIEHELIRSLDARVTELERLDEQAQAS